MYILGLNAFHGDSSACIFKKGELLVAIEEERLRRVKHWAGFPSMAISACLKEAGISIEDVDHITISKNPSVNIVNKIKHTLFKSKNIKAIFDRLLQAGKVKSIKSLLANEYGISEKKIKAQIHNIEHHRSHMASAFLASPFEEAAILSIDGFGDFTSTMIGVGRNNNIEVFDSVIFPHSIGVFYTAITQYLGFLKYGDEYKVMGLAPYGNPKYIDLMKDIVHLTNDGLFKLNEKYFKHPQKGVTMTWDGGAPFVESMFSEYMVEKLGTKRDNKDELTQYHKDIASSAQKMVEIVFAHILEHLHKKTGLDKLCIAGGVAQNSVANGKVYSESSFKNVYVPSAGTDAGTAIGSALYFYNVKLGNERIKPILNANLGIRYTDEQIKKALEEKNLKYKILSDEEINETLAEMLVQNKVIGWFKDASEFGPRALGYRSIITNPGNIEARDLLNLKIKKRELFRPFAPSILEDFVDEYFEQNEAVPFMEKVFIIKQEKRSKIPAVTHVDGTGRLQTVSKRINPKYYNMIYSFYKKSGIPLVLNTSFNENEPIVNSPEEAIDTYLRTKMDVLVLENYIVIR